MQAPRSTRVRSNGLELCVETFGRSEHPAVLLVMGLGQHMTGWDESFCQALADRDLYVIRFDNRDVGQSSRAAGGGRFTPWELVRMGALRLPIEAPYSLADMAEDARGLLDALGVRQAHVVGLSMGGMIAQELTLAHPDRVLTLTSIMSHTGNRRLPLPTRAAMRVLLAPPSRSEEEFVRRHAETWRVLRVGSFPRDEALDAERARTMWARGADPAGAGRQLRAIFAADSRVERLAAVQVPTLVLHGTLDPLIRPAAALDTAAAIRRARLVWLEGIGHALPVEIHDKVVDLVARHVGV